MYVREFSSTLFLPFSFIIDLSGITLCNLRCAGLKSTLDISRYPVPRSSCCVKYKPKCSDPGNLVFRSSPFSPLCILKSVMRSLNPNYRTFPAAIPPTSPSGMYFSISANSLPLSSPSSVANTPPNPTNTRRPNHDPLYAHEI